MKILFFVIVALLTCTSLQAQVPNIKISDVNNPEEPSIFINTRNPALVMAAANIHSLYYSQDSGKTWARTAMTSQSGVWGDPCIISDTAGDFYFFHLANPPAGNGHWIDRIVCQKYDVDSAAWTIDSFMGRKGGDTAQDKHWAVVDPRNNSIYVTWTEFDKYGSTLGSDSSRIMFSRSLDAGATWSKATKINRVSGDCIDSDNTTEGAVPAVGPNGEIYVGWAGPEGLVFDRSVDGGTTWLSHDIFIDSIPGGWDFDIPGIWRANGLPITLCDLSQGPYRGTIYVNWSDQRNGTNNTDVWLAKSTDGGNSWSAPLRVNNDTGAHQQFFTWMTIDQSTGYLYAVFYDRRHYSDLRTDVYLAVSKDGGQSFANYRISKSPFVPNHQIFFGDYTNISAHDGMVRPIWTRLNNDSLSVWTALIRMDSTHTALSHVSVPDGGEHARVYPNPANRRAVFSFKVRKEEKLSIRVLDSRGRTLRLLVDKRSYKPGMYLQAYEVKQDHLSPGLYFFELQGDRGTCLLRKFIVQ